MIMTNMTPTFITFEDCDGRYWKALALIAPLESVGLEPVNLRDAKELDLRIHKFRIVGGGTRAISG